MSINAQKMQSEGYVTVAQAAQQLAVHPSTIRRWIDQGRLPAFRVGQKRIGLRLSDLARMVRPRLEMGQTEDSTATMHRSLTQEEQQRGLQALAELERLDEELLRRRAGRPVSPAWEVLNETRDARADNLTPEP
jgi:excisionase family DNA binding protein